jgi:hypothetical protein
MAASSRSLVEVDQRFKGVDWSMQPLRVESYVSFEARHVFHRAHGEGQQWQQWWRCLGLILPPPPLPRAIVFVPVFLPTASQRCTSTSTSHLIATTSPSCHQQKRRPPLHPCCCQINPCSNFTSRRRGLQQILSLRPWRGKTTVTTTTMSRHRIVMRSKTLFFYGCKLDLNFSFGQRLFFVQWKVYSRIYYFSRHCRSS